MKRILILLAVVILSSWSFAKNFGFTTSAGFGEYVFNGDYRILEVTPAIGLKYSGIDKDLPISFMIGTRVSQTAENDDSRLFFRIEAPLFWKIGLSYGFYFWKAGEYKEQPNGELKYFKSPGLTNPFVSSKQFLSLTYQL